MAWKTLARTLAARPVRLRHRDPCAAGRCGDGDHAYRQGANTPEANFSSGEMTLPVDPSGRPNTVPWPPIIFACAAGAAFALGRVHSVGDLLPGGNTARALGAAVMVLGVGLDVAAIRTLRRHHPNILLHRAASAF